MYYQENFSQQNSLYSITQSVTQKSQTNYDIHEAATQPAVTEIDVYSINSVPSNWSLGKEEDCCDADSDCSLSSIIEEFMYEEQQESIKLRNERLASAQRYHSSIIHDILHSKQQTITNEEEQVIHSFSQVHIEDTFDVAAELHATFPCPYNQLYSSANFVCTNDSYLPDTVPYCEDDNNNNTLPYCSTYSSLIQVDDVELPDTLPYESDRDSCSSSVYDADDETVNNAEYYREDVPHSIDISKKMMTESETGSMTCFINCGADPWPVQKLDEFDLFDPITEEDIMKLDAMVAISNTSDIR